MASFLKLPLGKEDYVAGDTFPPLIFTITDGQDPPQPIDLTGARIRMSWRNKRNGQVVRIIDSDAGQISIAINVVTILEFTNNTPFGKYDFDLEINQSGNVWTPILGDITIIDDVTK
jgi:hypothetical protein